LTLKIDCVDRLHELFRNRKGPNGPFFIRQEMYLRPTECKHNQSRELKQLL